MTMPSPPVDWTMLAGLATGRLGWPPDRFWASTPVELAAALRGCLGTGGPAAPSALARQDVEALIARFPDH